MDNIPDPKELEEIRKELRKVFTCQICGMPKTHHRLYGYRCNNPEHAEMERNLEMREQDYNRNNKREKRNKSM